MTDNNDGRNAASATPNSTRTYSNNADINIEIERRQRLALEQSTAKGTAAIEDKGHSDSKPLTDGSPSGAAISKKSGNKNALRHGGYFNGLLAWESPEEFEASYKDHRDDCKPHGALQEEVVLSLAQWSWKRRRVLQGSQISYFRSPVANSLKTGEITLDEVIQYQATVPEQIDALISSEIKLANSLSGLSDEIGKHHYWTNTDEGKDIQMQLYKMRTEISALASSVRTGPLNESKNIKGAVEKITNLYDQAYQPEEIEKQVRLLSMIDREIDKAIRRLIFLKTFRSVEADEARKVENHAQPLIESPSLMPSETSTLKKSAQIEKSVEAQEGKGTPEKPVAQTAPEHRKGGKPGAD